MGNAKTLMNSIVADDRFLADYVTTMQRLIAPTPDLFARIRAARDLFLATRGAGGKVIFAGNGGSASISSHLAIDLAKNAGVAAICFNEASLITCLGNDYGYENWMLHALRLQAQQGDCFVAISSSGKSRNILNAVGKAKEMDLTVVTMSGMAPDNPLRGAGDVDFWVDSCSYNLVETAHQFLMMSVIDLIIGKAEYPAS
jgi:D-sedoheptulose 7-phosphate isomerase